MCNLNLDENNRMKKDLNTIRVLTIKLKHNLFDEKSPHGNYGQRSIRK